MVKCSSIDLLSARILKLAAGSPGKIILVLVGGCSRAGKTGLVSKLAKKAASGGVKTAAINLDSWLVSLDKRKKDATVLERYEVDRAVSDIEKVRHGNAIYPPVYDIVSRSRITESGSEAIAIDAGVLFIDGVIALAIDKLSEAAALRIFVNIPDDIRGQRLVKFYSDIKGFSRKDCEDIIEAREKEEVPFIKSTSDNADVIFNWE